MQHYGWCLEENRLAKMLVRRVCGKERIVEALRSTSEMTVVVVSSTAYVREVIAGRRTIVFTT